MDLKIELNNIGTFKKNKIELNNKDKNIAIITGSIGKGKTTLLKAISSAVINKSFSDVSMLTDGSNPGLIKLKLNEDEYTTVIKNKKKTSNHLYCLIDYDINELMRNGVFKLLPDNKYANEILSITQNQTTEINEAIKITNQKLLDMKKQLKSYNLHTSDTVVKKALADAQEKQNTLVTKEQELKAKIKEYETYESNTNIVNKMKQESIEKLNKLKKQIPMVYKSKEMVLKKLNNLTLTSSIITEDLIHNLDDKKLLSNESKVNLFNYVEQTNNSILENKRIYNRLMDALENFNAIESIEQSLNTKNDTLIVDPGITQTEYTKYKNQLTAINKEYKQYEKLINNLSQELSMMSMVKTLYASIEEQEAKYTKLVEIKNKLQIESISIFRLIKQQINDLIGYDINFVPTNKKSIPITINATNTKTNVTIDFSQLSSGEKISVALLFIVKAAELNDIRVITIDKLEELDAVTRYRLIKFLEKTFPHMVFIFSAVSSIYTEEQIKNSDYIFDIEKIIKE